MSEPAVCHTSGEAIFSLEHVDFAYARAGKPHTVLRDVNFALFPAQQVGLYGPNGSGKSTLLRAMAGLGRYDGSISVAGHDIAMLSAARRARLMAFVSTERTRIGAMSCFDIVAMGRAPHTNWIGRLCDADIAAVESALEAVGMSSFAGRRVASMSDGECQRVMIARALAQDTPLILMDEPTSFLDLPNRYELCSLLARLTPDEGKCILFSTHELDIAMQMCDNIILLDNPTLYNLPPAQLAASGHIERLFRNNTVSIDGRTGKINLHGI